MDLYFPYLIIGGGIGGVTCAEKIYSLDVFKEIGLLTASKTVKTVTDFHLLTKRVHDFKVEETSFNDVYTTIKTLKIIQCTVEYINEFMKYVCLSDGRKVKYDVVCICTGGRPNLIHDNNEFVIGIRDTESVIEFKSKLADCNKIVVVGNGGIATELVYEITNCQIAWLVKDQTISCTFMDSAAATFMLESVNKLNFPTGEVPKIEKQRHKYTVDLSKDKTNNNITGGALGPDWSQHMEMKGNKSEKRLEIIYKVEVVEIITIQTDPTQLNLIWNQNHDTINDICPFPVCVKLSNSTVQFCDLIVSGTGVIPQYPRIIGQQFDIHSTDKGILVDETMKTNIDGIYAAGDCCYANWEWEKHWFQMRLWSQARSMGISAAESMVCSMNNSPLDFSQSQYEMFSHVTKFFGYSIVLLGLYNGQKLDLKNDTNAELIVRVTREVEYIKLVVVDNRIQGAMFIGDIEMAETIENLIFLQLDISQFKDALLDDEIDMVDYFD